MTSREEFEAWAEAHFGRPMKSVTALFGRDVGVEMFEAWEAARAGMVRKEELRGAWLEGANAMCNFNKPLEDQWNNSNAKKAVEAAK